MADSDRKTVMISSTARDLPEHREQVRLGCIRAGFAPDEMMEHLTAADADAVDVSMALVEEADVYLGIFAHRYGYRPNGGAKSITEMEYDRAGELGTPRLIFFIHDDHPVKIKDVETGDGADKLKAFKDRVGTERVAAFFKSAEDLRGHVVEALGKLSKTLEEGTQTEIAQARLHRRSVIPEPPELYAHPPYTLLPPGGLQGRQEELRALTDWVAEPRSQIYRNPLFCLVAIGGMGKSALAWHWLHEVAPRELPHLAGRLWWSFYESDATVESFLTRALAYVAGMDEAEAAELSLNDRATQLVRALNAKPFLLVLDGLERTLQAYHRMDAAYLADDDLDDRTANAVAAAHNLPQSAGQSFVGKRKLRRATDPRFDRLLQYLAQVQTSRVLITTRLYPAGLQLETGAPCRGCAAHFLKGLTDDDAVALWRALGVSGSRAELVPVFRSVESHPLLVRALASEVARYRPAPRDFARWRQDHPGFNPATLKPSESRTHILEHALQGLSEAERAVLITLVGFRLPTDYATLEALSVGEDKPCADAKALDAVLTALEDRGLIGWDRAANRYDAHPIVRGVVWDRAAPSSKETVLTELERHFEPMATPDQYSVESLAELAPAIERFYSLVGLQRFEDAFVLFRDRISRQTFYRLAAHRERLEMLERLFPQGIEELPALDEPGAQSYALNALAASYLFSGRPGAAADLYRRAADIDAAAAYQANFAIDLRSRADALRASGGLREAQRAVLQALELARGLEDRFHEAICCRTSGGLAGATGDGPGARIALARAWRLFSQEQATQSLGVVAGETAAAALQLGEVEAAQKWAERAGDLAAHERVERDVIRAALAQGKAALAEGDLPKADERLHQALHRARAVNLVEFELPALIALAQLYAKREQWAQAREHLDQVWEAAEVGPYPMEMADARNTLAAIERAQGNRDAAIEAASAASVAAWCDGPPYVYHWGLEEARAHLQALGAPAPDLRPFDEASFEPLPAVEINPRDEFWVDPDGLSWSPEAWAWEEDHS